jgi:hypothetical protein
MRWSSDSSRYGAFYDPGPSWAPAVRRPAPERVPALITSIAGESFGRYEEWRTTVSLDLTPEAADRVLAWVREHEGRMPAWAEVVAAVSGTWKPKPPVFDTGAYRLDVTG